MDFATTITVLRHGQCIEFGIEQIPTTSALRYLSKDLSFVNKLDPDGEKKEIRDFLIEFINSIGCV